MNDVLNGLLQCRIGTLYLEGEVAQTRDFGLCYVHFWFCHNCYPCTTGACYLICSGDMEYGNTNMLVLLHIEILFSWICFDFS